MTLAFNINITGYLVDFKGYSELSGQEKLDKKLGLDIDDDELEDFQILEKEYTLRRHSGSVHINPLESLKNDGADESFDQMFL